MTAVVAHAGHWAISLVYVIPFILFFWLIWRERQRAKKAAAAGVGAGVEDRPEAPVGPPEAR